MRLHALRRLLLLRYGQRPNELIVKKLALLGCVAAVLAHAVKGKQQAIRINAYAGGSRSACCPCKSPSTNCNAWASFYGSPAVPETVWPTHAQGRNGEWVVACW